MSISLQKGGAVSLSKSSPGLSAIRVGLGWDVRESGEAGADNEDDIDLELEFNEQAPASSASGNDAFDLDASLFLLNASGRVRGDDDFIFYNNLNSSCGSVRHTGDNRTGEGEGDDEVIHIDLSRVPVDVQAVRVCVSIHEPHSRGHHFGMVKSAFMRVVDTKSGSEIARYDLSEQASGQSALVFGDIRRDGDEWQFHAIGEGRSGGLAELARSVGVNV